MTTVAEGGLVMNPGGGEPSVTPEKTGLGTNLNQGVPNLSLPQAPVFHSPLSTQPLALPKGMGVTSTFSKIPPLMDIRPNVTVLPPPQTAPTRMPKASVPLSTHGVQPGPPQVPADRNQNLTQRQNDESSPPAAPSLLPKDKDSTQEASGTFHPKLPILRLKKTGGDDDTSAMFERQDASKNDSYCWVCHDGGDVLCCDKCPRVFHIQCSGLPKAPEGDEEWYCSVCKNIARKTKRSRPPNLKDLLLLAVNRMMFPGTEIFQAPVPPDIMTHYREYIFFPLDLGTIREKVAANKYQSTRDFTHDTEWILHNCIIYNGAKHALTKIAKGIVKVCKEDMREIELCPGCYGLTVKQPKDWFCIPCNPPHPVVLAKVRGYPLWPAKLISETSDKCDVRFFGQHDRSLVPKAGIAELVGLPPKPSTKTQHWNIAMLELKKYGENINMMQERLGGGKISDKPPHKSSLFSKPKDPKAALHRSDGTQQNHYGFHNDKDSEGNNGTHYSLSNHLSIPSAVVEVSPSDGQDGAGALRNSIVDTSEPSSPGSPGGLQIDLDGSSSGDKHSLGRGKLMVHGRSLNTIKRNSQVSGPLDFNDVGPQAVGGALSTSPASSNLAKYKRGVKGRKAGEALSALVSSLAERKRVAEMGVQGGVMTPVSATGTPIGGGGGVPSQESMETDQGVEDPEDGPPGPGGPTDSPFSSIYHDRNKTAIALVDPDAKRVRKRKKPLADAVPPVPKKAARTTPGAVAKPTMNGSSEGGGTVNHIGEQALGTPSDTQDTVTGNTASVSSLPTNVNIDIPHLKSASTPTLSATLSAPTVPPTAHHHHQQHPHPSGFTLGIPSHSTPQRTGRGSTPSGTKKKSKSKGTSNRSPNKGARAAAAALVNAASHANTTATTAPHTVSAAAINSTIAAQVSSHFSQALSKAHDSGTSTMAGVRGEVAAPGMVEDESPDFEGSGLLAETIRKVDKSFRARVNHMAGGSDDMGYQYFMEKLMTSVKTVLIEMLSTFDAKSKLSAKHLKEQLHTCWPVPDSKVALDQLRKELRDEMKQSLEVVRAAADLERRQVVNEVKRQVEKEKELAVSETKKKKWCSYCWNEAQYNCCWNANYCNETCQQSHWPEHMKNCTQVQQQPTPRTPAPMEMPAATPVSKDPPTQVPPINTTSVTSGPPPSTRPGVGGGQDVTQHGYLVYNSMAAAAAAQAQAQAMQQQQQQQQQQGHIQPQMQMMGSSGGIPTQLISSSGASIQGGGIQTVMPPQAAEGGSGSGPSSTPTPPHPLSTSMSREHSSSPYLHLDGTGQLQQVHRQRVLEHAGPVSSLEQQSAAHIEQIPNENLMITSANTASPPTHIRTMLLNQQHQHQQTTSAKIAGMNLMGQAMASTSPLAMGDNNPTLASASHPPPALVSHSISSDHSHSSNPSGLLQPHTPMSPATPPSENPPSVHSYGGWPYHQQPVIIGSDSYPQGLPLLPTMQASTPTTQNQAFFKASF